MSTDETTYEIISTCADCGYHGEMASIAEQTTTITAQPPHNWSIVTHTITVRCRRCGGRWESTYHEHSHTPGEQR